MRNVAALTQREFRSFVFSPVAYGTGVAFLAMTGALFLYTTLVSGNESTMRPLFMSMASVFVLCIPILTMRLLADEYSTGTIETLMTAPVTDVEVVVSKFLGVLMFYCSLLVPTIVLVGCIGIYGKIDVGVTLVAYLGMVLLGALYSAVGVFASACTRHQLLAAIVGIGVLSCLTFLTDYISLQWPSSRAVLAYVNVLGQFDVFSRGIFDSTGLIYFLTGTGLFLFLAVKVLESRRWR